jgi:hypothetical protein
MAAVVYFKAHYYYPNVRVEGRGKQTKISVMAASPFQKSDMGGLYRDH